MLKIKFHSIFVLVLAVLSLFTDSILAQSDYLVGNAGSGMSAVVDGIGSQSSFNGPSGIALVSVNVAVVTDWNGNTVRMINFTNTSSIYVSTIAGTSVAGYQDGPGSTAKFNNPSAICTSASGIAYISDYANLAVRKLNLVNLSVSTLMSNNNLPRASRLHGPRGLSLHPNGASLFLADVTVIYQIDLQSLQVSVFAGSRTVGAFFDGIGTNAYFAGLMGMAMVPDGSQLLVTDVFVQVRDSCFNSYALADPSNRHTAFCQLLNSLAYAGEQPTDRTVSASSARRTAQQRRCHHPSRRLKVTGTVAGRLCRRLRHQRCRLPAQRSRRHRRLGRRLHRRFWQPAHSRPRPRLPRRLHPPRRGSLRRLRDQRARAGQRCCRNR